MSPRPGAHRQRPLDTIIDGAQQPRPQFDRERSAGILDRFARLDARSILVNLDDRTVAIQADDFAHQLLVAYKDHVVHAGSNPLGRHNRA